MVDVRFFSTISQEVLLLQQQTLHELLQDLEQALENADPDLVDPDLPDWNNNPDLMSWLSSL